MIERQEQSLGDAYNEVDRQDSESGESRLIVDQAKYFEALIKRTDEYYDRRLTQTQEFFEQRLNQQQEQNRETSEALKKITENLDTRVRDLERCQSAQLGVSKGLKEMWGYILGAFGLILGIIGFFWGKMK